MSATQTILNLPDQRTATLPKRNYINNEDGLLSWLLLRRFNFLRVRFSLRREG